MRRYGRFSLDYDLVMQAAPVVTRILGACAIVRAEPDMLHKRVQYHAVSYKFREIEHGEIAPAYNWYIRDDGTFDAVELPHDKCICMR